jgi:hypothetical protein
MSFEVAHLGLVVSIKDVGQVATTAVLTVVHGSHENTCAALEIMLACEF